MKIGEITTLAQKVMLLGHYIQKLSNKGRTALPARLRSELGPAVILSRWYEGSLAIFEPESWKRVASQLTGGLVATLSARDTERFLMGAAWEVSFDSQGRFVIPKALLEYAKLGPEVVFIGLGNRIEVWDKETWQQREAEIEAKAGEIVEQLWRSGLEKS